MATERDLTATNSSPVTPNDWQALKQFTDARIALGRAGSSLPTREWLAFQLAHAQAQDAVELPLDIDKLSAELAVLAEQHTACLPLQLRSQAATRGEYLQRPDYGRRLAESSRQSLRAVASEAARNTLAICIVDGLSSCAVQEQAAAFVEELMAQGAAGFELLPIALVEQGRVAVGDEIGEMLGAEALVVLVGERPGLSSPDSLGAYFTWKPKLGRHDAERNCISNIRPGGLSIAAAVSTLCRLLEQARQQNLSGVRLKLDTEAKASLASARNFLTGSSGAGS